MAGASDVNLMVATSLPLVDRNYAQLMEAAVDAQSMVVTNLPSLRPNSVSSMAVAKSVYILDAKRLLVGGLSIVLRYV